MGARRFGRAARRAASRGLAKFKATAGDRPRSPGRCHRLRCRDLRPVVQLFGLVDVTRHWGQIQQGAATLLAPSVAPVYPDPQQGPAPAPRGGGYPKTETPLLGHCRTQQHRWDVAAAPSPLLEQ